MPDERLMRWSEEMVSRLKKLVVDGISYKHIADDLGISRSAVAGKVNRLGLTVTKPKPKSPAPPAPAPAPRKPRTARGNPLFNAVPKPTPEPVRPRTMPDPPSMLRKTFFELENCDCRWPLGEPGTPGFAFCAL